MRDSDVNLYDVARLRRRFGAFLDDPGPGGIACVERELAGESCRRILGETTRLVAHQWREHIEDSAVKGFLFHGGVGVGKTTMAKRMAYELARLFGATAEDAENEVVLVLVDGADIARSRYGDSEERLAELFEYAREGETHAHRFGTGPGHRHAGDTIRRTVLLFDDVESLFLARSADTAREWHFSQNSVFFHAIDEIDTAHTAVVLTTNRLDLVDAAIADRLLAYAFPAPAPGTLVEVARALAAAQHLGEPETAALLAAIAADPSIASVRTVERLVTKAYVEMVTRG